MNPIPPILVADLFPEISEHLLALLRSLSVDDWHRPTVSSKRTVKDIASHLLDGTLRRLSMQWDGYFSPDGIRPDESLQEYLNRLNAEWEIAARRLSPQVLIGLIAWADEQLASLFQSLDPFAPAIFPVAWAGEDQSENWFDVARDYTEKWHHTQQIFEATGKPSTIMSRRLYHPCLDTFMRALPFTFREVEAPQGSVVATHVAGEAGGDWYVQHHPYGWKQLPEFTGEPTATAVIPQESAWKLVTKRRDRERVLAEFSEIQISGDRPLGMHVLEMISVMA